MAIRRLVASAALAVAAWGVAAGAAQASSITVHPGQSIQHAVNRAHPGDTIRLRAGVYRQNVTIRKRITLIGAGDGRHGSRLRPGKNPVPSFCNQGSSVNGICVVGKFDTNGNPGPPVRGVTIKDLRVRGFSGFGILMLNANHTTVRAASAIGNAGYGISGFGLHGVRFINNVAASNGEPGFYIGDSPNANAVVTGNRAFGNGASTAVEGIGFLFRDSSWGRVWGNIARNNCAGMVFVDTAENPAPATHWTAWGNVASHNNLACEAEPGGAPPLSGIGITLFGASDSVLLGNRADNNRPSGPSVFSGGIVVASSVIAGGADPANDRVARNHAHGNSPLDILYDGTGFGNVFAANDCGTSNPSLICN